MSELLSQAVWVIQQKKEWGEILAGFESANKYAVHARDGGEIGYILEEGSGAAQFLKRLLLRSHRPFTALVLDRDQAPVFRIRRPWFWLFSTTLIETPDGRPIGSVERRFRILSRHYDLDSAEGRRIGFVHAGFFRIWKFDLLDPAEQPMGSISKKWGGLAKEIFTDADRFAVVLEGPSAPGSEQDKAVVLGSAIALDFDFFEDNQRR